MEVFLGGGKHNQRLQKFLKFDKTVLQFEAIWID